MDHGIQVAAELLVSRRSLEHMLFGPLMTALQTEPPPLDSPSSCLPSRQFARDPLHCLSHLHP